MGRERRRLLIPPGRLAAATAGAVALEPPERHYLRRVLRLRPGDAVEVVDGAGRLWSARLEGADGLRLEQPVGAPLQCAPPPAPRLRLALAVPRREADLAWRMATELGADDLQPLQAARCVRREALPLERWGGVVREACEQCERLWQPRLAEPQAAAEWLARPPRGALLLATTRREGRPSLLELSASLAAGGAGAEGEITLAIGPEGGWTPQEEEIALAAAWQPVGLGALILRSATAAVAGMAVLALGRDLSRPSSPSPSP
ncbi:MAG: RsmE family RNA methyltransferase [Synechococcaceae cyanobacterium]|nr:RsmE family RNA methyltransferase [Synechococcaceae cyanobacterium]